MFDYFIVAIIVLWSAWFVFKKVTPTFYQKCLLQLSQWCSKFGWSRLANWLKPTIATGGCSGGCGCKASEPPSTSTVKWK